MLNKTDLIKRLNEDSKQLRAKVTAFTEKVSDPNEKLSYHLKWSRDIFEHTAKLETYECVVAILSGDSFTEDHYNRWVSSYLQERVLKDATRVANSSSETYVLMEREENAAWASVYEIIQRGF